MMSNVIRSIEANIQINKKSLASSIDIEGLRSALSSYIKESHENEDSIATVNITPSENQFASINVVMTVLGEEPNVLGESYSKDKLTKIFAEYIKSIVTSFSIQIFSR